jgi:hypothetical protein
MNQNQISAVVIFGNFVLLSLPMVGVAIDWKYLNRNEPQFADYLVVLAPVAWLIWALCKNRGLDQTDSKILRACSALNTALIFIFIVAWVMMVYRSCSNADFSSLS